MGPLLLSLLVSGVGSAFGACQELPASPAELQALRRSDTSLTLGWSSTPRDGCSTSYHVFLDGLEVQESRVPEATLRGLEPQSAHRIGVVAINERGSSPESEEISLSTLETPAWPARVFAPYIDVTLAHPELARIAQESGTRFFSLAFIVSHHGACEARWGGAIPLSRDDLETGLSNLREGSGDVIASFGGAAGRELAVACPNEESLEAQYQDVIDTYSLTRVDFDIEGKTLRNRNANDRRNRAIAGLQETARLRGRRLIVSYTLPVNPTGLDPISLDLLRNAVSSGVNVGVVNIMTMDYFSGPLEMGKTAIQAAKSTFEQLRPIFPGKSDPELWEMIGNTPMIGVNDDTTEIFGLADAEEVATFSLGRKTGFLAFWDTWRDQPCPSGTPQPSNTCSGVVQDPFAFSGIFNRFTSR
jgi:chitinase